MNYSGIQRIFLLCILLLAGSCTSGGKKISSTCQNGILELHEECDRDLFWGQTCESFGFRGGFLSCSPWCTVDISTCHGYKPTCGNGIIEDFEECDGEQFGGFSCESFGFSGGQIRCTAACTLNTSECQGTCVGSCALGTRRCIQDHVEVCEAFSGGCNTWVTELDCAETGGSCVTLSFGQVRCEPRCTDVCTPGETRCSADSRYLLTCMETPGVPDCTWWKSSECGEGTNCLPGREPACRTICDMPCDSGLEGSLRCSPEYDGTQICMSTGPDCHQWVLLESCGPGEVCLPWMNQCGDIGTTDSCEEALVVHSLPFLLTGIDFAADFQDGASFVGAPDCKAFSAGPELFWQTYLAGGEAVVVSSHFALPLVFRVHGECGEMACLGEDSRLVFVAPESGMFLFSAEGWGEGTGEYDIRMHRALFLDAGADCQPGHEMKICGFPEQCIQDSGSSTGYSCRPIMSGDTCVDAVPVEPGIRTGDLVGMTDQASFEEPGTVEQFWQVQLPVAGPVYLRVHEGSYLKNILILSGCSPGETLFSAFGVYEAEVILNIQEGETLVLVVEKTTAPVSSTLRLPYTIRVMPVTASETGLCDDEMDNDMDGLVDCGDPDCAGLDPACMVETACDDGLDNDGDGLVDCADPDCAVVPVCFTKKALYSQLFDGQPAAFQGKRLVFTPSGFREYQWQVQEPADFFVTPFSNGVTFPVADDALYSMDLPMLFPFFGEEFSTVWISSNGFLAFHQPSGPMPYESPTLLLSLPVIAVLWDDLSRIQFGDEFAADWGFDADSGRIFWAFTFHCREYSHPLNHLLAQVVLFEDGEIRMDYLTCGIEDGIIGIASPGLGPIPESVDFLQ